MMTKQNDNNYLGVVRQIMDDGRLCIPAEYWKRIGVKKNDQVQILLTRKREMLIFPSEDKRHRFIGVDRVIGSNGQICIPAEYRQVLNVATNKQLEILLTQKQEIIIRPYNNM